MSKKRAIAVIIFYVSVCVVIFNRIFTLKPIAGGDYTGLNQERAQILLHFPFSAWQGYFNLGQSYVPFLSYSPYDALIGFFQFFIPNTLLLERIVWWLPFLLVGGVSIYALYKHIFPGERFGFLSPFLFLFNSYALIIISGGQISGIGLAYALLPCVVLLLIRAAERKKYRLIDSLLLALALGSEAVFDVRIAYITVLCLTIFLLYYGYTHHIFLQRKYGYLLVRLLIFPLLIVVLLHAYWLLPTYLYRQNPFSELGAGYTTLAAVKFLSFAKLENTISLLHPNWPENIFGKTGFMRPEFLMLPIIAFSSLLFINKKTHTAVFFSFLAFLGIFLAKGANDPFGMVYVWMFGHIPGFILFRDATKWYPYIALSYALLFPFALGRLYARLKNRWVGISFVGLVLLLFFYTIRFAISGTMGGLLNNGQKSDMHYRQFAAFIADQPDFFRTLWVPANQRFGYASNNHPAINSQEIFALYDRKRLYTFLASENAYTFIKNAGVKYVVIPEDTHEEIFLNDRKYSEKEYMTAVAHLSSIPWLTHVQSFGKIQVFALADSKNLFYLSESNENVHWRMQSPTHYQITPENGTIDGLLVFSEAYNPYWQATLNGKTVQSEKFAGTFNAFRIPGRTTGVVVDFIPQQSVNEGLWISLITLIILCTAISLLAVKEKKYD